MTKVIAITGGKGGIGKTNIATNLSIALAKMQQEVLLLDADMGLSNIDVLLDLKVQRNLQDVLNGDAKLQDIIVEGPHGIKIIPGTSGNLKMAQLNSTELAGLVDSFSTLDKEPNILTIDTAAGMSESVLHLTAASDEIVVVVCNEPTSIADAYALIKVLNLNYKKNKFRIVVNKVASTGEVEEVFAKLTKVTDQFLNVALSLIGSVPKDKMMERAVRRRKAVVSAYPNSASSMAITEIASKIVNWPAKQIDFGNYQFFTEKRLNNLMI